MKLNFTCGGNPLPSNGLVHIHFINPRMLRPSFIHDMQPTPTKSGGTDRSQTVPGLDRVLYRLLVTEGGTK